MKKGLSFLLVAFLLGFVSFLQAKVTIEGVDLVEYGMVKKITDSAKVKAPKTSTGYITETDALEEVKLEQSSNRINAYLGADFGVKYQVQGKPYGDIVNLKTRVLHPPMKNPKNGKTTTSEEWEMPTNIGIVRFTGWRFEHEWELVPGQWTIQILKHDQKLAEKTFEVIVN